jgi:signal transduction histidine kinase
LVSGIANFKTVTGRFTNFAKSPQLIPVPMNLNDLVRSTVKLFEPQFSAVGRPPITPELHLDEDLPVIQADSELLQRAVENLILNAMDAMPAGGVLMLRTTQRDGGVHLEVADTGMGLSSEEREHLFTPGYAMKPHGADMALAVVQAIVSDHGGRMSVETEAGVGTSFHIHLLSKPPQRPAPSVAPSAGA